MSEAVFSVAIVLGGLLLFMLPVSRLCEDFPHVDWQMVLIDLITALVWTALGTAIVTLSYVAFDAIVLAPIREIIQSVG